MSSAAWQKYNASYNPENNTVTFDPPAGVYALFAEDIRPPSTSTQTSQPSHAGYVSTPTYIYLDSMDNGSGVNTTFYRVWHNGSWTNWTLYSTGFLMDGEGIYYLEYYSIDQSGNNESIQNETFQTDNAVPTTTLSIGQPHHVTATTYVSAATPFTLTAIDNPVDNQSGVNVTWYTIDGLFYVNSSFTLEGYPDGWHTITWGSRDYVGNNESGNTRTVYLDAMSPDTHHSVQGQSGTNGWYLGAVSMNLTACDDASGVNTTLYRVDEGAWQTYVENFTLSCDGVYLVSYYSADNVGGIENVTTVEIAIDTLAPVTQSTVTGTLGENDWYVSNISVSLNASDNLSGVNTTWYRVDTGAWQVYQDAFIIAGEGTHAIRYYSVDQAGNIEAVTTEMVAIDATPPVTTATPDPPGPSGMHGWYTDSVTINLTSIDQTSGVDVIYYRLNTGPWTTYTDDVIITAEGNHSLQLYAVDAAGNQEPVQNIMVHVDTTPPDTTVALAGEGNDPYFSSDTQVTLTATDGMSGINATYYQLDGSDWTLYTTPVMVAAEGQHSLSYYAQDKAGLTHPVATTTFTVDTTPPSLMLHHPDGGTVEATQAIQWTASDALDDSLSITIHYRQSGGDWQLLAANQANTGTYNWDTKSVANGNYQVRLSTVDDAGNTQETVSSVFAINNPVPTPPTVSIASPVDDAVLAGIVTVTGTAAGDEGIEWVEVRINDGVWDTATGTTSWSYTWNTSMVANGQYSIAARSYDGTDFSSLAVIDVTVYNPPPNTVPTVHIVAPTSGTQLKGRFTIRGTASDPDGDESLEWVELKIGNELWMVVTGTTSWSYRWDTTTGENGNYTIQARAYDGTHYSEIDSITVTVQNEDDDGGGFPGFEFVLLIIAAGIALFILHRKRRC
ncbi:MAG: OmpL47-type beta-barrel domain-containing protein, partial [Thermoplasmatota archaeon]